MPKEETRRLLIEAIRQMHEHCQKILDEKDVEEMIAISYDILAQSGIIVALTAFIYRDKEGQKEENRDGTKAYLPGN